MTINRTELDQLTNIGINFNNPYEIVDLFEKSIAKFYGAKYAVATDCATHALELCFRLTNQPNTKAIVPKHTYMSVPMMLEKINQEWEFANIAWENYYKIEPFNIIDASTHWEQDSYQQGTLTCLSFQFKKHLPIGRGGMILLDNFLLYEKLKRLAHDGRTRGVIQDDDDVTEIGYHYYMTPEDAARGILLMTDVQDTISRKWSYKNYKDLTELSVFSRKNNAQESA